MTFSPAGSPPSQSASPFQFPKDGPVGLTRFVEMPLDVYYAGVNGLIQCGFSKTSDEPQCVSHFFFVHTPCFFFCSRTFFSHTLFFFTYFFSHFFLIFTQFVCFHTFFCVGGGGGGLATFFGVGVGHLFWCGVV